MGEVFNWSPNRGVWFTSTPARDYESEHRAAVEARVEELAAIPWYEDLPSPRHDPGDPCVECEAIRIAEDRRMIPEDLDAASQ